MTAKSGLNKRVEEVWVYGVELEGCGGGWRGVEGCGGTIETSEHSPHLRTGASDQRQLTKGDSICTTCKYTSTQPRTGTAFGPFSPCPKDPTIRSQTNSYDYYHTCPTVAIDIVKHDSLITVKNNLPRDHAQFSVVESQA